ncbi:hypothetical protein [Clostridium sp. IODB-O3]|nr:MAG TPA_asm: hypothetical protein [Caudoviricetes sp.]
MKCSKEIAKKVEEYQKHQEEADKLYEEISEYFTSKLDAEGFNVPFIADKPSGDLQNDDEYCDQRNPYEDYYEGEYYHQIEGSDKYVGYSYSM